MDVFRFIVCLHFASLLLTLSLFSTVIDLHTQRIIGFTLRSSVFHMQISGTNTMDKSCPGRSNSHCPQRYVYSVVELFKLCLNVSYPVENVRRVARELGIEKRKRGRRAGSHIHRPINSVCNVSRYPKARNLNKRNVCANNLITIQTDINANDISSSTKRTPYPSILLSNLRSLSNKLDDLIVTMNVNQTDIAVLCETWLNDSKPDEQFHIPGFTIHRRDRRGRQGGGVAIYTRSDLNVIYS